MRAMAFCAFGGPEVLAPVALPVPEPGPGQVRAAVNHASANPADAKTCRGLLARYITCNFPFVPGFDLAGTVDAVGPGVTQWAVGDAVFGTSRVGQGANGSFAQYTLADVAMLAPLPAGISSAQAACLPTAGTTALGGLTDVGRLCAGQTVLINGGAGGVGSIAIQIANHLGARVLATCSAHNIRHVMDLGADLAIDYRTGDVVAAVRAQCSDGVDLVLDAVGQGTLSPQADRLVRRGGAFVAIETLICEPDPADVARAGAAGVRVVSNMVAIDRLPDQLRRLGDLAAQGVVCAPVHAIIPLRDLGKALRMIETGHTRGKIAISVAG